MSLSPSEQEKLNEFQIISNFSDEDYEKVVKLLKNNYWNLEIALSKYFDGKLDEEADGDVINEQNTQNENPVNNSNDQIPNEFYEFQQANLIDQNNHGSFQQELLTQPLLHSQLAPQLPIVKPISNRWKSAGLQQNNNIKQNQNFISHFGSFLESPIIFLILFIPRSATLLLSYIGSFFSYLFPAPAYGLPDVPTLTSFNFDTHFEVITQDKNVINYYKEDFNNAFESAKKKFKFLILVLISDDENSNTFIKTVLNNDRVINLLNNDEEILTYIGHVKEPQSLEIAKSLKARTAPSVYLIANISNGPSLIASMSILARISVKSANSFVARVKMEIEKYKPEFISKKYELAELEFSRKIKEAQDRAYEESLLNDRIKKIEQESRKLALENKEKQELWKKENRLRFLNSINKKFNDLNQEELPKSESSTIRFQLPSGERIIQKFPKSYKVYDIYAFVELQLFLKENSELTATDVEVHEDYNHVYGFELISPFPRFSIPINEENIENIKQLWPNSSLLIEFAEDDDNDDN
ncbi:hypothetical protein WICMUC_003690 [Wickerhamomyces mucosus]|uniref:UBX domain-containing protein n=1 Tax=Wickerhamomyces mucosus TaxID=1378264 RepID=A0A9P8TCL9_9ASCO|nr:hypothetical protein WICMUC_003690 [Wickerhamomyces mucosus]